MPASPRLEQQLVPPLAGAWQNHKTGCYSYGICSPFVTYLLALLTRFEIFSIFQVSEQARDGSIHEISYLAHIEQSGTTLLAEFLTSTYEGAILVRKHLVMKLIYAGTFVLLLLGSAFLFIHPGAGIARAASPQTCGSWNVVSSKNPGTSLNFFNGVAALSSKDVWAVGYYANTPFGQSSSTLTEHWNGTHWRVISSPNPGSNS